MDPSMDLSDFDDLLNLDGATDGMLAPYNDLGSLNHPSQLFPVSHDSFGAQCGVTSRQVLPYECFPPPELQANSVHTDFDLYPLQDQPASITKPPVPCDYCAARGLECFFISRDESGCSCCRALFRKCTFVSHKPKSGWLDTLDPVGEDEECCVGAAVGTAPLFSHGASMNDIMGAYLKAQPERTSTRFPRSTTLVLKRWLEAHMDNPYPTDAEKLALKDETGLSLNQITTWLANARRRTKVKSKGAVSPVNPNATSAMPCNRSHANMDPFERWKHSPPEKEAPLYKIKEAAEAIGYGPQDSAGSSRSHSHRGRSKRSSDSSAVSFHAPSTTSLNTSQSSSLGSSAHSYGSHTSWNSHQSKSRRRRRNVPRAKLRAADRDVDKIYQCTFCTDTFHIKYDWSRHEKTMHLSLEKWVCHPLGPVITTSASGTTSCVYCQHPDPDRDHLDTHAASECSGPGVDRSKRTFYRKDHLRQHLKLTHGVPLQPWMEDWKIAPSIVRSRCGFCPDTNPTTFESWQDRADHLAKHFREGVKMKHWKGDHGFDPDVAAQVTNAMPPFMIDHERSTPDPFSAMSGHRGLWTTDVIASASEGINQLHQARLEGRPEPKISNCWQILTKELGIYTRQQLEWGVVPTDEVLQQQARVILYGDNDPWNQTAADNGEWLNLFKKAHGLLPSSSGSEARTIAMRPQQQEQVVGDEMFQLTLDDGDLEFQRLFEQASLTGNGGFGSYV